VIISMSEVEKLSREQIEAFLEGNLEHRFRGKHRREVYAWITLTMRVQQYRNQGKVMRGLLKRYMEKVTGRSRTQMTLLVARYMEHSEVTEVSYRRHSFQSRFTRADIELLAELDEAHETLSGPATKKILEREFQEYGHAGYERLAGISVAHLYNLRKRPRYRERRMNYVKTRGVQVAIGERRKPRPDGKPGYLRVDTVHQGDQDGVKGVYHINLVDEVTQWQMVACVAALTQSHLRPVLKDLLRRFPFLIRGFHSDNGSEFINDMVAGLLRDLLIEQTKSRARKSNDNGLVECKNGAVIRKHMGYGYIATAHAPDIHAFYQQDFNPYLNFHRPCGQPERIVDKRGKEKFVYKHYATPWETLRRLELSLPPGQSFLKPEVSIEGLDRMAQARSDTEAARAMQQAKRKLFLGFHQKQNSGERKTA
jgi:transposase InsO family protein